MVKERMDLLELLRKGGMDGDVDFLREALRVLVEGIMDAEVSGRIGAEYGERSPERVTQRNGYRSRAWDTRVGTMDLHIPKLREGSYFPSLLEPRRRSERALLAVIQHLEGVSTRRVDDLVKATEGISKSQVSRICQELDVVVDGFLGRPLDGGPYPYLWLDALTQKVREDGRIVNSAWWWRRRSMARASGRSLGWTWVPVKTAPSGWPSYARCPLGASAGSSWWSRTLIRDSAAPSPQSSAEPAGKAPTSDQPAHIHLMVEFVGALQDRFPQVDSSPSQVARLNKEIRRRTNEP